MTHKKVGTTHAVEGVTNLREPVTVSPTHDAKTLTTRATTEVTPGQTKNYTSTFNEIIEDTFLFIKGAEPSFREIPLLNRKVFRARRVSISEHPYIVSIRRNISHYLTGTLVSNNLVLTVAHPVYRVPIYELGVVVGQNYCDRGTTVRTVVLVIIHSEFDPYTLKHDIALLRFYEDVEVRHNVKLARRPANLSDIDDETIAFVTGWGRCDFTGHEVCLPRTSVFYPNEILDLMLRTIAIPLRIPELSCQSYADLFGITLPKGSLCVGNSRQDDNVAPCLAVPGAPLVVGGKLQGILSFGFSCGYINDLPMVYVDMLQHFHWLENNLMIMKRVSRSALSDFYNATRGYYILTSLKQQGYPMKPNVMSHRHPGNVLQLHDIDGYLVAMSATVYDIRDYIYNLHSEKQELFMELAVKLAINDTSYKDEYYYGLDLPDFDVLEKYIEKN